MKLQVLYFIKELPPQLDLPTLDQHYEWITITNTDSDTVEKLTQILRKYKPVCIVTKPNEYWPLLSNLPYDYRRRWITTNDRGCVEYCSNYAIQHLPYTSDTPLFSVITTTYHSEHKIFRVWDSLMKQTYKNWEWVIWDDSQPEHSTTWNTLLDFRKKDIRVNCYRDIENSGFIGEMKRRSANLAKGDWLVEIDHDDKVDPRLFEYCKNAIAKYPDADFICSDWIELFEDNENPFSYGEEFSRGTGSSVNVWYNGKWHMKLANIAITPESIRHIVGVPNHIRIWRISFYEKIGGYNYLLPVVDDYELLLRTFFDARRMLRLPMALYQQYRNNGGNNFTFLRNSLIQHLTYKIQLSKETDIVKYFKDRAIEDTVHNGNGYSNRGIWKRNGVHKYHPELCSNDNGFTVYDPTERQVSIIISTYNRATDLKNAIKSVINQTYQNWVLYVIGDKCPTLSNTMEEVAQLYPDEIRNQKIQWYNLSEPGRDYGAICRNYALRMLVSTPWICYLDDDNEFLPTHIESMMGCVKNDEKFVFTNFLVDNKEIICTTPVKGRIDTSSFMHHYSLLSKYGDWFTGSMAAYCNDWLLVSRWLKEKWNRTGSATLIYSTKYSPQTWESIASLVDDVNK